MERTKQIKRMLPCMRWYGPNDGVSLEDIRQAGVEGIVTALHHIPVGEVWTVEAISRRQEEIRASGMEWVVVESLPVSEAIKQRKGDFQNHIQNYKTSLRNLAACGVWIVTYNFMPVLDWVRTQLDFPNTDGSRTLRFSRSAFACFDVHMLGRPGAESDYSPQTLEEARALFETMSDEGRQRLRRSVLQGLPGSDDHFTEAQLLELLGQYAGIPKAVLQEHLVAFLREVVPVAAECGAVLAIHPDDPPYPLLGLPRVVSTQEDLELLFNAVPDAANGLCYCTGALGAGPDNDLLGILDACGNRVHFLHLRNVLHEAPGVFRESEHLSGHVPITDVVRKVHALMEARGLRIPMRPDHGFLHSCEAGSRHYPGYSLVGRLKGLAELRGLEQGLMA